MAVLAWGSLIWDPDGFQHVVEPGWAASDRDPEGVWRFGAGPALPIEFSRISAKRPGALTLVIDSAHGAPCRTAVALSRRETVEAAAQDLAARERAPLARIGVWSAAVAVTAAEVEPLGAIEAWAREAGCAGVVWTALESNFEAQAGEPFSLDAAARRLRALHGAAWREAAAYIRRAPPETDTPLRRALEATAWWREAASHAEV